MFEKSVHLIKQLNDFVEELKNTENIEFNKKKSKLNAISDSIERLQTSGVPVPNDLFLHQEKLQSEIKKIDNTDEVLIFTAAELFKIIEKINHQINKLPDKGSKQYKGRIDPSVPVTDSKTLRDELLIVIKELGGSSDLNTILQKMEIKLENRITPADKDIVGDGNERWINKVRWVRNDLVKEGIFKNNSPRGIWELSEDKK